MTSAALAQSLTWAVHLDEASRVADEAIAEAIDGGKVYGYVCDFPTNLLKGHARVITLPHLGASTQEAEDNCAVMVAHQSLNAMQATARSVFDQVVPHAPGPIGPVTGQEACTDLRSQLFVAAAALAARSRQPGVEATARDTERPAQPCRRPDSPVLRDEGELHMLSFAK